MPEPHLIIEIDGVPLGAVVAAGAGDVLLENLIPTLLDDLYDATQRDVVWSRALPSSGERARFPVLMCPDDCDFSCTLVVVEVETTDSFVIWHRFGFNLSDSFPVPGAVGQDVDWAPGMGPLTFARASYEDCLAVFRRELQPLHVTENG